MAKPGLPDPIIYEKEYEYWPWGKLISFVKEWLINNTPKNAFIVDYMCGTGYLLNELGYKRKDIKTYGCSITKEYIEFAKKKYRNINVQLQDALDYIPPQKPNIIIATSGIHHLNYNTQERLIKKVSSELSTDETFIIGEEIIRSYNNNNERKASVLELSIALISYIIENKAPEDVLQAALDLQAVDMFERGEYKLSLEMLKDLINPFFKIEDIIKVWPDNFEPFGDYILICKRK